MTVPTATPHVADTPMVFGDIATNLALYRDHANDLPAADIADASLRAEHIPRPRTLPFPLSGQHGEREAVYGRSFGLGSPEAARARAWGPRQRLAIAPWALSAGATWRLPLGWRVRLPTDAVVELEATWEWQVRTQKGDAVAGAPGYPKGTGSTATHAFGSATAVPRRAGYFSIHKTLLATGLTEELEVTRNYAYPLWPFTGDSPVANELFNDRGCVLWQGSVPSGTWDFQLCYTADADTVDIMQVDVGRFGGFLAAHM